MLVYMLFFLYKTIIIGKNAMLLDRQTEMYMDVNFRYTNYTKKLHNLAKYKKKSVNRASRYSAAQLILFYSLTPKRTFLFAFLFSPRMYIERRWRLEQSVKSSQ